MSFIMGEMTQKHDKNTTNVVFIGVALQSAKRAVTKETPESDPVF